MSNAAPDGAQEVFLLTCKRLEAAETALGASLRRLSALDLEIASLVIDRARSVASGDETSIAAIEPRRRLAALRIEDLRRRRTLIEAESEGLRDETKRLLRQKIALESALTAAADEERRRSRNR